VQARGALTLALAGLAGVILAVVLFRATALEEPAVAPAVSSPSKAAAKASPAPVVRASPAPPQEPVPQEPEPQEQVDTSPEAVARWKAEEPVAQHAERDAHRWREVGTRLRADGQEQLALQAESIAMRLERAMGPRPEQEVRDLLIEEINLFRPIHALEPDAEFKALLQSIEMGAHHAIQGAPTPEVTAEQERQLQAERQAERQGDR